MIATMTFKSMITKNDDDDIFTNSIVLYHYNNNNNNNNNRTNTTNNSIFFCLHGKKMEKKSKNGLQRRITERERENVM